MELGRVDPNQLMGLSRTTSGRRAPTVDVRNGLIIGAMRSVKIVRAPATAAGKVELAALCVR